MELVIRKEPVERKVSKEPVEDGYTHKKKLFNSHTCGKQIFNQIWLWWLAKSVAGEGES